MADDPITQAGWGAVVGSVVTAAGAVLLRFFRTDREQTKGEWKDLLKAAKADIRGLHDEVAQLRKDHLECVEKAARQDERIEYMEHVSDARQARIEHLEQQVATLMGGK